MIFRGGGEIKNIRGEKFLNGWRKLLALFPPIHPKLVLKIIVVYKYTSLLFFNPRKKTWERIVPF